MWLFDRYSLSTMTKTPNKISKFSINFSQYFLLKIIRWFMNNIFWHVVSSLLPNAMIPDSTDILFGTDSALLSSLLAAEWPFLYRQLSNHLLSDRFGTRRLLLCVSRSNGPLYRVLDCSLPTLIHSSCCAFLKKFRCFAIQWNWVNHLV